MTVLSWILKFYRVKKIPARGKNSWIYIGGRQLVGDVMCRYLRDEYSLQWLLRKKREKICVALNKLTNVSKTRFTYLPTIYIFPPPFTSFVPTPTVGPRKWNQFGNFHYHRNDGYRIKYISICECNRISDWLNIIKEKRERPWRSQRMQKVSPTAPDYGAFSFIPHIAGRPQYISFVVLINETQRLFVLFDCRN